MLQTLLWTHCIVGDAKRAKDKLHIYAFFHIIPWKKVYSFVLLFWFGCVRLGRKSKLGSEGCFVCKMLNSICPLKYNICYTTNTIHLPNSIFQARRRNQTSRGATAVESPSRSSSSPPGSVTSLSPRGLPPPPPIIPTVAGAEMAPVSPQRAALMAQVTTSHSVITVNLNILWSITLCYFHYM